MNRNAKQRLVCMVLVSAALGCLWAPGTLAADPAESGPQKTLAELRGDLDSRFPNQRRQAVRRLAEMDTLEGWTEVVRALRHQESDAADEAQIRLAQVRLPQIEAMLLGRDGLGHGNALVRTRVVEMLGRRELALPHRDLARLANDRDARVRRYVAWSVERQARAGRVDGAAAGSFVEPLDRARARDNDAMVRGAALFALSALAQAGFEPRSGFAASLESALGDRAFEVRAAAAAVMAEHTLPDAERRLASLAADESVWVRTAVVPTLVRRGDLFAARLLVERLENETQTRLGLRLVNALQDLSGQFHRRDPRPWRRWVDTLPEDWRAAPEARKREDEKTEAELYGLPILSDRLAVLIDMSGSMWTERADGTVLKDLVDAEMERLLSALGQEARFDIYPFATTPTSWSGRLQPANRQNVARAAQWFQSSRLRGRGNLWDAIELALQDPEADTLVIFSDGAPTGGPHFDLELIHAMLHERFRFRPIAVDHVLTGVRGRALRLWGEFSEATGGRWIQVDP